MFVRTRPCLRKFARTNQEVLCKAGLHSCRMDLVVQHKPSVAQRWSEKLPLFVRRLEQALYQAAHSKVSVKTVGAEQDLALNALVT